MQDRRIFVYGPTDFFFGGLICAIVFAVILFFVMGWVSLLALDAQKDARNKLGPDPALVSHYPDDYWDSKNAPNRFDGQRSSE